MTPHPGVAEFSGDPRAIHRSILEGTIGKKLLLHASYIKLRAEIGWVPRSNDGGRGGGRGRGAHRASETSKVYDLAAVRKGVCDPRLAGFTAESS